MRTQWNRPDSLQIGSYAPDDRSRASYRRIKLGAVTVGPSPNGLDLEGDTIDLTPRVTGVLEAADGCFRGRPSVFLQPSVRQFRAVSAFLRRPDSDSVLRFFLAAVLILTLAACSDAPAQADVSGLRLQREGRNFPTLTGYLVNEGDTPITSADVFVTLYDGDNRPMEDVIVQVRSVAAGDSARFERRLDLDASGAKLKFVGVN